MTFTPRATQFPRGAGSLAFGTVFADLQILVKNNEWPVPLRALVSEGRAIGVRVPVVQYPSRMSSWISRAASSGDSCTSLYRPLNSSSICW